MKNKNKKYNSLQGKFLISSPNVNDEIFKKSLIYIISDDEKGSMGLMINKPALKVNVSYFFGENIKNIKKQPKVLFGGPVELNRGFILHTNDYKNIENQIRVDDNLILSSDPSIITDILLGNGPSKSIFAIGYTGWAGQQLHEELKRNDWLELDLDKEIIFSKNHNHKWYKAILKLGINEEVLESAIFSTYSGSA